MTRCVSLLNKFVRYGSCQKYLSDWVTFYLCQTASDCSIFRISVGKPKPEITLRKFGSQKYTSFLP